MMKISEADVATSSASNYLRQLCRHWAHKFEVELGETQGTIHLPLGVCRLEAEPSTLKVRLEMPADADERRLEQVVAEHLQRFGFREPLLFEWCRSEAA